MLCGYEYGTFHEVSVAKCKVLQMEQQRVRKNTFRDSLFMEHFAQTASKTTNNRCLAV